MSNYKSLDAWILPMQLVTKVYELTKKYPKDESHGLISQIRRAAVSVPANVAEGMGRQHKKDTRQFLFISRASLYELDTLLNVSAAVGIVEEAEISPIMSLITQCLQVINGLIKYVSTAKLK